VKSLRFKARRSVPKKFLGSHGKSKLENSAEYKYEGGVEDNHGISTAMAKK